jgi:hypothetical protein
MLQTLTATRYITPLREGGSLPALVEANNGERYVLKFRGAGQGPKALIAEVIAGEIARALGLPMPELTLLELDPALGRSEPDSEIQDLLKASTGLNLGMRYLPQALDFNLLLPPPPNPTLASDIVWFDAYVTNIDRTPRNVNLLLWHKELWLIDHGAALYVHHSWHNYQQHSQNHFPLIKNHTLLAFASELAAANERLAPQLTTALLTQILAAVPDSWLASETRFGGLAEQRAVYVDYLTRRLEAAPHFTQEAIDARTKLV